MKILYLVFAVFFLVLQGAPGQNARICRRRGGFCGFGRCPFNSRPIGSCGRWILCCRRPPGGRSGFTMYENHPSGFSNI
ncbi:antimicrobial peptide THP1-like [Emydura macquarii macquarii]|uniref:antimicrobial peptide THP1-like n=1 Tax=Emydura macquarii macquarii TaxID=1129001 RepID=UPI00352BA018